MKGRFLFAALAFASISALYAAPEDDARKIDDARQRAAAAAYKVDCERGDMTACYYTGLDYEVGKDPLRAKEYYEKACKGGESFGCYFLGSLYLRGAGASKDPQKAAALFKQTCDMNNASGCVVYGGLQSNPGTQIKQNLASAKSYYEKACSLDASKCDRIASLYYKGLGVERDFTKSKEYYSKACDGGNKNACEMLANNDEFAFALSYVMGSGVKQDLEKGMKLLGEICEGKSIHASKACVSAGDLYADRKGQVGLDYAAAKARYEKACSLDASECDRIASLYARGLGAERDFVKAGIYYAKACENGNANACNGVKAVEMYSNLNIKSATCDDAPKLGAACTFENVEACNLLGEMLSAGKCKQDLNAARTYYAKACDLLDNKACGEYRKINEFLMQLEALRGNGGGGGRNDPSNREQLYDANVTFESVF